MAAWLVQDIVGNPELVFGTTVLGLLFLFVFLYGRLRHENPKQQEQENLEVSKPATVSKKRRNVIEKRRELKSQYQYSHQWLLTTLKGHCGRILDMDFSSNGKYLASCADGDHAEQSRGLGKNENYTQRNISPKRRGKKVHQNGTLKNLKRRVGKDSAVETPSFQPNNKLGTPLESYFKLQYTDDEFYQCLFAYVLTKEDQKRYGFPVECPGVPGKVIVNDTLQHFYFEPPDPSLRTCCRCGGTFLITPDGKYAANQCCIYHWGKKQRIESFGTDSISNVSFVYSCCGQGIYTSGCSQSTYHVSSQVTGDLNGFVKIRPRKNGCKSGSYGVYSLDCEMCYTLKGLEVVKVSVVGVDGLTVYDTLVLPENPIIDYNTNFSGITADDLIDVRTTLEDVQTVLLKLFNSKTILIGHGLENDLKALRLMHETVIDTSVVFPHYNGLPFRRSLKSLIKCYLRKNIQDNGCGHNSIEDARACMELMLWKLQKDQQALRKSGVPCNRTKR